MIKLLVNAPSGEQRIEKVEQTGSYADQARVIWDERNDGSLPDVTLGKMQRSGAALIALADFLPAHAAWMAEQAEKQATESDIKNDGDLAQLRPMSGDEINAWFDVNVTNLNQTIKMLKKVVKSLVKQGTL